MMFYSAMCFAGALVAGVISIANGIANDPLTAGGYLILSSVFALTGLFFFVFS